MHHIPFTKHCRVHTLYIYVDIDIDIDICIYTMQKIRMFAIFANISLQMNNAGLSGGLCSLHIIHASGSMSAATAAAFGGPEDTTSPDPALP